MTQPTWNQITKEATSCLDQARAGLSEARDWLASDWHPDRGPADHEQRREAARLISQAKALIDQAKTALDQSTRTTNPLTRATEHEAKEPTTWQ